MVEKSQGSSIAASWSDEGSSAPAWMRFVLKAAGVYNVLWGAFAILFPTAIFRWAGFEPLPEYPELWQCIGMIVGVYGVGYWIAGTDPFRHWPIVLVGLLGKVFGPIGFLFSVSSGRFPPSMGWTILTNDLIWWVPFAAILLAAARHAQTQCSMALSDVMPTDSEGRLFDDVVSEGRHLVVLLRHAGCTFCRETLATLSKSRRELDEQGWNLVLVHMGREDVAAADFFAAYGLGDVTRVSDPGSVLYRRFQLPVGKLSELFGLRVWVKGFQSFFFGRHGIGKLVGNGFQLPGTVFIEDGRVLHVEVGTDAAYVPDVCATAASVHAETGEAV